MSQAIPINMSHADASRNLGHAFHQLNELCENIANLKINREEVPSYLMRQQTALRNEINALKEILGENA